MNESIRKWLPRDRRLALIEGTALGLLVLFVIARWLTAPTGVAEAAPVTNLAAPGHVPLPEEAREALRAAFPAPVGSALDRVEVLADIMATLPEMNLRLDSRQVESTTRAGEFPQCQRVRLTVRGRAQDEANFLRFLTLATAPVSIRAFRWSEGDGPEDRRLELQLDFLLAGDAP
ncbi:MAG: hypothetical protein AB7O52_02165 [Planctomycetota bacterium]